MTTEIQSDLSAAAEANLRTSALLLVKEALITAIQDRRLERGHLRVLAAIGMFMNSRTAKAWPSRAAIASMTGLSVKTVSNNLLELRNLGYLISDRENVEDAGNRRLTVYTFGNIDHDTIRNEITKYVMGLREGRNEKSESPRPRGTSPSTGNIGSPPAGKSGQLEFPACGAQKSPPAGRSNSKKELKSTPPNGGGAKAPSQANTTRTVRQILWHECLAYFRQIYGTSMSEEKLRQRLGMMVKEYGEGEVLMAIAHAQKQETLDPINYMAGILKTKPSKNVDPVAAKVQELLQSEAGKALLTKFGREEAERRIRETIVGSGNV